MTFSTPFRSKYIGAWFGALVVFQAVAVGLKAGEIWAQTAQAPHQSEAATSQQQSGTDHPVFPRFTIDRPYESWMARELRRNKTFPHLEMAYRKERAGNLQGAVKELESYLAVDQLDDNVWLQLVILLARLEEDQRAVHILGQVIANHPKEPLLYVYRSELLRRLGELTKADDDLSKALSFPGLTPSRRWNIRLALADLALTRQEFDRAWREVSAAEILKATHRTAMIRALSLAGQNRHAEALEAFERARDLAEEDASRAQALSSAAEEAVALRRYGDAREYLSDVELLTGLDASLSFRLGTLSLLLNDDQAAIGYLRTALTLGDDRARDSLVMVLVRSGHLKEAERLASEVAAEAKTPDEKAKALMTLGTLRERQDRLQKSAEAFAQAVAVKPSAQSYLALARIEGRLGRAEAANESYKRALALASDPETRFELSMLLAGGGHAEEAVAVLEKAIAEGLAPEKRLIGWKQIGLSALASGNATLAEKALANALLLNPADAEVATAYADVAFSKKNYVLAAHRYERLLALNRQIRNSKGANASLRKAATSWASAGRFDKALETYKKYLHQSGLTANERSASWLAMGYLYQKRGEMLASANAIVRAVDARGMPRGKRSKTLQDAANIFLSFGDDSNALALFERALSEGIPAGRKKAGVLRQIAQIELRQGDEQTATACLREALVQPHISKETKGEIYENLGNLALKKEEYPVAEREFQRSIDLGGENVARLLGLGYALYSQGKLTEARSVFQSALDIDSGIEAEISLSHIYGQLGQPGLALYFLRRAEPGFVGLPPEEQRMIYSQYGYYLEKLGRPESARIWYGKSLNLGADPVIAFQQARVEFALHDYESALKRTESIDPSLLPDEYRIELSILRARIALALCNWEEAEVFYQKAIDETLSDRDANVEGEMQTKAADFFFELGGMYEKEQAHEAAAESYAEAVNLNPTPARLLALGYQELALKNFEKARLLLSEAVALEPDYIDAHQDLGYIFMQLYDNEQAIERFKTAIDLAPLKTDNTPVEKEELLRDVYRLRGEARALENQFDADLYLTYTSGQTGTQQGVLPGPAQDVVRTDSGLEVAWIPPKFGFRDHKIFKFIGRLTWTFKPDSLRIDSDSLTGAVGVRYKPFKAYNLNVGLEKLFPIGDNVDGQTVIRLLDSFSDGTDLDPVEDSWNYSFLFGELDAYLESVQRVSIYAEGRQGFSWKAADNFTIAPFLVADARWWSEADDVSFYEGGVGTSLRFLYGEDKYERPSCSVELLMTYKLGQVFNSDNIQDKTINAFFATMVFHF